MTGPEFARLPIDADEGFPQAFRLAVDGATYTVGLHVNVPEEALPEPAVGLPGSHGAEAPGPPLELSPDDEGNGPGFLVLSVAREDPSGPVALLRRKVVPGLHYRAGDLVLTFRTLRVAPGNLNGVGAYGSQVVGGVAVR